MLYHSSNLDTISFIIFHNHGGIYRFLRKFSKIDGEIVKPKGVYRNMRGCIIYDNSKGIGYSLIYINTFFICYFVEPELGLKKKENQIKLALILKLGLTHLLHWFGNEGLRKTSSRTCLLCFFIVFSVTKKRIAFQCFLDLNFYTLIIGLFSCA